MEKLTIHYQGYYDRLHRAESWLERAQTIDDWEDQSGPFIFYWIALNALYGRDKRSRLSEDDDLAWFLDRICHLDQAERGILAALKAFKLKADRLLADQFLVEGYWHEGNSSKVKRGIQEEQLKAQQAWDKGKSDQYLTILFRRLRVLRNQIFHGCSTDRRSLNKTSLQPAVELLEALVPQFVATLRKHGKDTDWPPVPYPRKGSPLHPR